MASSPSVSMVSTDTLWQGGGRFVGAAFASGRSASGTPDRFVAQMVSHSGTSILHVYAKVIDKSRREAIKKFEAYRQSHLKDAGSVAPASPDSHLPDKRPSNLSVVSKKPFVN
jgi:hypothetical protein